MIRTVGWNSALALLAVLAAAPPAPAAPVPPGRNALALVPEKAPLVVYLHGVERTRDRLITLLKTALPDQAAQVEQQINDFLKNGPDGKRTFAGLEKDGPVFLALLEMPGNFEKPPKMAIVVAVSDYAKFRDGLLDEEQRKAVKKGQDGIEEVPQPFSDDKMYFLDKKGWAVIASDKEVAESFTKDYKGLDGKMSKDQAAKLLDGDLGIYLSMDVFNKDYAEQIKAAREAVNDNFLKQLENAGVFDKATVKVYKTMIESAFQAVEDSQGLLATVEFRPTGLALHLETEIRQGSKTAKTLKAFQTSTFADLGGPPSGHAYYTAARPTPELLEAIGPLMFGAQGNPAEEDDKAMKAALEKILKAGPVEALGSATYPAAGVQLFRYNEPTKAVEGALDLVRALKAGSSYGGFVVKDKATVKMKAEKYKDIEMHAIEVPVDFEKTLDRGGQAQALPEEAPKGAIEFYKKLYGEKTTAWVGTDGKAVVQVAAPDWKAAQKLLDAFFDGKGTVADDAAFKELRKELPAEATMYGALDPVLYGAVMAEGFRLGFEGAGMGMFKLPPGFPAKPEKHVPAYFGLAVTLKEQRGSLDVFLSARGILESYKAFGKPLLGLF